MNEIPSVHPDALRMQQEASKLEAIVNASVSQSLKALVTRIIDSCFNQLPRRDKAFITIAFDIADSPNRAMAIMSNIDLRGSWPTVEKILEQVKLQIKGEQNSGIIKP